ncbi:MAG TPA: adenylate/guanylate cyclase domain-containing protein [Actinomycetota bacterium]|nr:adenylate/guanylate cyclase domain-containing protein [Actinomycetota bacterium]
MEPDTYYVRGAEGVSISYQVVGDGPVDLVSIPHLSFLPPLDSWWQEPRFSRAVRRLASFSRLILFDRRGIGLSDRVGVHPAEQDLEDISAVMDAVGSERAALLGWTGAGMLAMLFAATHPERCSHLVLYEAFAAALADDSFTLGQTPEAHAAEVEGLVQEWGTVRDVTRTVAPDLGSDQQFQRWWARYERLIMTPRDLRAFIHVFRELDVRPVLSAISVPTLIVHREGSFIPVANARFLADRIDGSTLKILPGAESVAWLGDWDSVADEIEDFIGGKQPRAREDRALATILFTDIVGSTQRAAEVGDRRWRSLLDEHDEITRREIERHGGRFVGSTGDGVLAVFDGPARTIRCARAIGDGVRMLGLEIRAGVHAGEIELRGDNVGGIAVHIGARIAALAEASEVLVSRTVKDLVVGSGLSFVQRGSYVLKGVPDEWQLYAVAD